MGSVSKCLFERMFLGCGNNLEKISQGSKLFSFHPTDSCTERFIITQAGERLFWLSLGMLLICPLSVGHFNAICKCLRKEYFKGSLKSS